MDAVQFLNSVYLGDRSITGITVDSSNMTIKIHIGGTFMLIALLTVTK